MAMVDHRRCDVCDCKTFYDADLDYQPPTPERVAAGQHDWWLRGVGDWAVICPKCAETKMCVVMNRADLKVRRRDITEGV